MAQRISPFASLKPTEKDLDFVADSAGGNWRSLLTHLGIKLVDIESFQNGRTTKYACFKGLVHWLKGNVPDEPVIFDTLFHALKDSAMTGCISLLEEKLKARSPLNRADQDLSTQTNIYRMMKPYIEVPTVTMAGMESKIDSSLDIFGVEEYLKGLIGDMAILGAVLGIRADTQAIINRNGKPNSQLLEILDVYIAKESPTWGDFCTALKKYHGFNKVRVKIQRDHNYKALECT